MSRTSPSRGFTLIELLVVVAIIALLISILLPTLARAKEQGRIAVCLSNLKNVALASAQYRNEDTSNDLPWCVPFGYAIKNFNGGQPVGFNLATEFIWGGGMPDRTAEDCSNAGVGGITNGDIYRIPPRFRPMNKYVDPQVSFDGGERDTPADRLRLPMQLPGVYQCPSDRTPFVPTLGANDPRTEQDTAFPTWQYWGTSFASNWYWPNYYRFAPPGSDPPYNRNLQAILGLQNPATGGLRGLGKVMLNSNTAGGWESRFVTFYENLWNYLANTARPQPPGGSGDQYGPIRKTAIGWHKQLGYHSGAYLDGHADYKYRDTRFVEGPGWTTWPNRPWGGTWANW